jgi:hypothetical protein
MKLVLICLLGCLCKVTISQGQIFDSVKIGLHEQKLDFINTNQHVLKFHDNGLTSVSYIDTSYLFKVTEDSFFVFDSGHDMILSFTESGIRLWSEAKDSSIHFDFYEPSINASTTNGYTIYHTMFDSSTIGITYEGNSIHSFMFFNPTFGAVSFLLDSSFTKSHSISSFHIYGGFSRKFRINSNDLNLNIEVSLNKESGKVEKIAVSDRAKTVGVDVLYQHFSKDGPSLDVIRYKELSQPNIYLYKTILRFTKKGVAESEGDLIKLRLQSPSKE